MALSRLDLNRDPTLEIMKKQCAILCVTALLLLSVLRAAADPLLLNYSFADLHRPTAPSEVLEGLKASDLSYGETIAQALAAGPASAEYIREGGLSIRSNLLPQGTMSEGGHYIEFSLQAPEGRRLYVTDISVTGRRTGDLPALYVYPRCRTSYDDYDAVLNIGQIKSNESVKLSQPVNGLSVEGKLTLRLYLPAINRGLNRLIIQQISLSGQIAAK